MQQLLQQYNGRTIYHENTASAEASFTIRPGAPRPMVNNLNLPAGSYTVWYENEQSLKAKLELVTKYRLRGAGSWSLNQETADTWQYYTLWLNGHYFVDAEGHWAEAAIVEAANRGWMTGISPSEFAPGQKLTRAQAAVILVRALGLNKRDTPAKTGFTDVSMGYWASREIAIAAQEGLVNGLNKHTFAPDKPLTRAQMCALVQRALAIPNAKSAPGFADVPKGSWSASPIAALAAGRLVNGFPDGTFRPQASISRAEMAVLLQRINAKAKRLTGAKRTFMRSFLLPQA